MIRQKKSFGAGVLADGNDVSTSTEGFGSVSEVDAMDVKYTCCVTDVTRG